MQSIMQDWTKKTGYPVVTVEEEYSSDKSQIVGLHLSQERFLRSGEKDTLTIWKIPIDYITQDNRTKRVSFLMTDPSVHIKLETPVSSSSWIKLNVNQTGLYRVQYSSSMLERLKKPIQEKVLNNVDRLSIIGDAFAVAICGRIPMADVFSVLQAYKVFFFFFCRMTKKK